MENMVYTAAQHEREMTRVETQARRWFIAFIAVLLLLFTTNIGWIAREWTTHTQSVTAAGDLSGGEGQSETDSGMEENDEYGSEPGSV